MVLVLDRVGICLSLSAPLFVMRKTPPFFDAVLRLFADLCRSKASESIII